MSDQPLHGTVAARWIPGSGWRGVLITGPSGAGKSDLALRLIGHGWRLVADDYAHVFASGGSLFAVCPGTIAGRIEARGIGVIPVCALDLVRLVLAVELSTGPVERLPEPAETVIAGVRLPLVRLCGLEPSAVEKVTLLTSPL
ncbi:HPr kinase/phosphatase C-terminal domain-containing protein [Brevundimonas sp.]|uniref:HPr kinase/phosphorylase n=1 Tax=Brevundimonas sp. TaxID=1871086 RepID=UPI002BFDBC1D|nr:HPr kinase/phosphatase C-terminal domain-containing protein [Brevundimonas sp.]HWQ85921.1 HPr kinase/phosphatase C-terminal domain-containing protein [Brevundimonas sp.]